MGRYILAVCLLTSLLRLNYLGVVALISSDDLADHANELSAACWPTISETQLCAWTGRSIGASAACTAPNCTAGPICVPAHRAYHQMDSLLVMKQMEALRCPAMASMAYEVRLVRALFGRHRKLLSEREMQREITSRLHKVFGRMFPGVKAPPSLVSKLSSVLYESGRHHSRRLAAGSSTPSTSSDDSHADDSHAEHATQPLECPTDADVSDAATIMKATAAAMIQEFDGLVSTSDASGRRLAASGPAPGSEISAESHSEEYHQEYVFWTDMLLGYMEDPERLKEHFHVNCSTQAVTTEPLLSVYSAMEAGDHGKEAAHPSNISVCRPKPELEQVDLIFYEAAGGINHECAASGDHITNGHCMDLAVAHHIDEACFAEASSFLEIPDADLIIVHDHVALITTQCADATTMVSCEEVTNPASEMAIKRVMNDAAKHHRLHYTPSAAASVSGFNVLGVTVAIGVLIASFL